MLFQNLLVLEEDLAAVADGCRGPGGEGDAGRLDRGLGGAKRVQLGLPMVSPVAGLTTACDLPGTPRADSLVQRPPMYWSTVDEDALAAMGSASLIAGRGAGRE